MSDYAADIDIIARRMIYGAMQEVCESHALVWDDYPELTLHDFSAAVAQAVGVALSMLVTHEEYDAAYKRLAQRAGDVDA